MSQPGTARDLLDPRLHEFGTSVFTEMTQLAMKHQAINLAQGFPDFDGPEFVLEAAERALRSAKNQYAPSTGIQSLREAIARYQSECYGLSWDPGSEVTVFTGATEAIFSSIQALVHEGDEVLLFEPYYDSYPASVAIAGGRRVCIPLSAPDFAVPLDLVREAITDRTRVMVINSPMNPCGRVFTREELEGLAEICIEHDLIVISDEVYEWMVFDEAEHIPIASIPGMRDRTVTISSASKTFSVTGWKVGWACAGEAVSKAIRSAHQFTTFSSATPLQHGVAYALENAGNYYNEMVEQYAARRSALCDILEEVGFQFSRPAGTYFVLVDFRPFGFTDDVDFCRHLTENIGVAAIPPSFFYDHKEEGKHLARFAFCKELPTLQEAGEKLRALAGAGNGEQGARS